MYAMRERFLLISQPPRVGLIVVIKVYNFWHKCLYALGDWFWTHAVDREIHWHKGHGDIAKGLDFRDAFSYPR